MYDNGQVLLTRFHSKMLSYVEKQLNHSVSSIVHRLLAELQFFSLYRVQMHR